jgi:ABC-2 type transport system ATP-binding protein
VSERGPAPPHIADPRPPGDPAVLVDDLVVRFGDFTAVGGVSFAVAPGETFGLLGPNGAGKTTTIRVLTTLLAPTAGRALVAGHDVRGEGLAVRACIGYIPQAISVDGALTAYENLDFYGRVTGVPRRERRERIAEAVATMDLGHMLDRLARTLSGGMLRRLEIASALLNRPRVLFLDEPTVGLDPNARTMVWERLQALRAQEGTTVLVTTHVMEEAERHCDRLGVIDRGRLIEQGEPGELIERHHAATLEEVFTTITGRPLTAGAEVEEEGRLADVRAQRRVARRLG